MLLNDILRSLSDPHTRHAMIVHFPLALGALGVLPLIVLSTTKFSSRPLKVLCLGWFLVASGAAALAANAGGAAKESVEKVATGAAKAALHDHEELGENGWIWPLIPAGLVVATFVPRRKVAVAAGSLAIAGALGVAVWAAYTGHSGGQLVYTHGLGVPAPGAAAVAPTKERDKD
jgi:uncharacterized membrane protein